MGLSDGEPNCLRGPNRSSKPQTRARCDSGPPTHPITKSKHEFGAGSPSPSDQYLTPSPSVDFSLRYSILARFKIPYQPLFLILKPPFALSHFAPHYSASRARSLSASAVAVAVAISGTSAAAAMDSQLLEINLISAQRLKPPPGLRRVQSYAVAWVDPSAKLRTRVDRVGGENPTWNEKFIFHVPAGFLADDSPSAVSVEIYAAGGWYLPDSLVGTVRLLIGNERLLRRPRDAPAFAAVGIRRPSGRIHGVLNVGAAILSRVSLRAAEALAWSPAVGYRDLMGDERARIPRIPSRVRTALKDANRDATTSGRGTKEASEEEEAAAEERGGSDGGVVFCGPCFMPFPRRIHLSPSDQNLQIPYPEENPTIR